MAASSRSNHGTKSTKAAERLSQSRSASFVVSGSGGFEVAARFEEDLAGVDGVLPHYVGCRGYGGDGVEEGHGHPYGQYGVFLPEALCAGYAVAAMRPDAPSDHKLCYARHSGYEGKCYHLADFR